MRLEQLQYCIEIANCKSMTKAAKQLYINQSALSISLASLETELGYEIFTRSSSGMKLTNQGQILVEKAQEILNLTNEIKTLDNSQNLQIKINFALIPAASNIVLIDILKNIKTYNSNIDLNIIEIRPSKIMQFLIDGNADIIIGCFHTDLKATIYNQAIQHNIYIQEVYQDQMYAFLNRNHSKAKQKSVSMQDFTNDTIALFNEYLFMQTNTTKPNTPSKNSYYFSEQNSIKKVVSEGLAYAILPYSMAFNDIYIKSGLIKVVPLNDVDLPITIFTAYKNDNYISKEKELITDIVSDIYKKLQTFIQTNHNPENRSNLSNYMIRY